MATIVSASTIPAVYCTAPEVPAEIIDGVIDYDAQSEAKRDRNLWTEQSFGDFDHRGVGGGAEAVEVANSAVVDAKAVSAKTHDFDDNGKTDFIYSGREGRVIWRLEEKGGRLPTSREQTPSAQLQSEPE